MDLTPSVSRRPTKPALATRSFRASSVVTRALDGQTWFSLMRCLTEKPVGPRISFKRCLLSARFFFDWFFFLAVVLDDEVVDDVGHMGEGLRRRGRLRGLGEHEGPDNVADDSG